MVTDMHTKAKEMAELRKVLADQSKEQKQLKQLMLILLQQMGIAPPDGFAAATSRDNLNTPEVDFGGTTKTGRHMSHPIKHTESSDNKMDV